jgi:hypothetical protein
VSTDFKKEKLIETINTNIANLRDIHSVEAMGTEDYIDEIGCYRKILKTIATCESKADIVMVVDANLAKFTDMEAARMIFTIREYIEMGFWKDFHKLINSHKEEMR